MSNMESTLILNVSDLSKQYRGRYAVKDISFQINKGEYIGLIGENGAGKSTILKCITGMTNIDFGSVKILDYSITTDFEKAIRHINGLINSPGLYKSFTGLENLNAFAILFNTSMDRINEIISLLSMQEYISKKVSQYSFGMRQRLGIGISLLSSPELLLLDEPTNGLDPTGIIELRNILMKIRVNNPDLCLLIASHNLSEIEKICDKVIILSRGEIIRFENLNNDRKCNTTFIFKVSSTEKINDLLFNQYDYQIIDENQFEVETDFKSSAVINRLLVRNNIEIFSFHPKEDNLEKLYMKSNMKAGIL